MFRRTKGFAGCILLCARSPWLEGGRNPFAFGKSTLEKQINTEITAWQVPFLSQLFLPRSVQQHRGFGSKATSESLFPLQSLILIYEQDLAGKWTHVGKQANSFFFFPFFIIIFGVFLQRECCFQSMDPSLEHWCWHKAGQHPMVLEVEGLHQSAQAQITASAVSFYPC